MLMNRPRLEERLLKDRLDALVATSPENVTYMSGLWNPGHWNRRLPQVYALWPAEERGNPCIITSTVTLDLVTDQDIQIPDVRRFGFFAVEVDGEARLEPGDKRLAALMTLEDDGDPIDALVRALEQRGLQRARLGIDEIGMLPSLMDRLCERLPQATLVRASDAFRWVRAVKTEEEIARLRRAANIAEASIQAALEIAREGVAETELAAAFHTRTIELGGFPESVCIGTGPRSALSTAQAGGRLLSRGDVIRFDGGGRFRQYRADIARIATLGEPSAKVRRYHEALRRGVERAYDLVKPGTSVADVFDAVVETVRREGLSHYRRNNVGHGIGLDGNEIPNLIPSSGDVIEENMVLCIETPYYELGFAGLQVEDMVVVRQEGLESFMTLGRDLRIV